MRRLSAAQSFKPKTLNEARNEGDTEHGGPVSERGGDFGRGAMMPRVPLAGT